jgi:hypothetical protein
MTWLGAAFTTLRNDKVFSLIFLGAAVAMLLWFAQTCGKSTDVPLEQYNRDIATWKDTTKKLFAENDQLKKDNFLSKHERDSLAAIDTVRTRENRKLKQTVAVVNAKADSLFRVASGDTSMCVNLCNTWKLTAIQYKATVATKDSIIKNDSLLLDERALAYAKLGIRFDSTVAQNDRLAAQLKAVPVYKEEKFLGFIPLPSRKTSLVVGLISGVVITSAAVVLSHR